MVLVVDLAYSNAISKHIYGKDVDVPIDWSTINPLPDVVITKVSELNFTDPTFVPNWHGIKARGALRGGYHFYRNGQIFYNSARQAKIFSDAVIANGFDENDRFVLDNEEKDARGNSKVSLGESLDWFYNVKMNLSLKDYSQFWLYSTADILNNLSTAKLNAEQLVILKSISVWVAGYPEPTPTGWDGIITFLPARYTPDQSTYGKVVGWQYAEGVPNISNIPGGTDLNQIDATYLLNWKTAANIVVVHVPPVVSPATIKLSPNFTLDTPLEAHDTSGKPVMVQ